VLDTLAIEVTFETTGTVVTAVIAGKIRILPECCIALVALGDLQTSVSHKRFRRSDPSNISFWTSSFSVAFLSLSSSNSQTKSRLASARDVSESARSIRSAAQPKLFAEVAPSRQREL